MECGHQEQTSQCQAIPRRESGMKNTGTGVQAGDSKGGGVTRRGPRERSAAEVEFRRLPADQQRRLMEIAPYVDGSMSGGEVRKTVSAFEQGLFQAALPSETQVKIRVIFNFAPRRAFSVLLENIPVDIPVDVKP